MKASICFFIVFLFAFALPSCSGSRCADGTVIDKDSQQPLDSVLCTVITGTQTAYTDEKGHYSVCNHMGACDMGCKSITVEFSKPGFKPVTQENNDCNGEILMVRE
jgi:hypothetical protein